MDSKLIDAITYGYNTFINNKEEISQLSDNLLSKLLDMTESEYGFISEYRDVPSAHIHIYAITNISWNKMSQEAYSSLSKKSMDFYNQDTLFSLVYQEKQIIISNDVCNDSRRGGKCQLPKGHPRIDCFAGIPLFFKDRVVGVIGIANHKNGYTPQFIKQFDPFIMTISHIIGGYNMEFELKKKNKRELEIIRELADTKSRIWSMVSHDIRSPINGILGTLELFKNTILTNQQQKYMQIISSCSNHLHNFINDILDYSKYSAGKMKLNNKTISLEECMYECYDIINIKASKKNIELLFHIDDDVPDEIISDKKRIKQLLINILSNALKFTHKGSITTNITVNYISDGRCNIIFSTTDTGIGIAEDKINTLFIPFNQAHDQEYGGTGLGLSICKEIVELFNGDIYVKSVVDIGSTFTFNIIVSYVKNKVFNPIIRDTKILVVDESESNRLAYLKMFVSWGMHPQLCSNSYEALEYLKVYKFDMLFMDSRIKGMDCNELSLSAKKIYKPIKRMVSTSIIEKYPDNFDIQLIRPISNRKLYNTIVNLISAD